MNYVARLGCLLLTSLKNWFAYRSEIFINISSSSGTGQTSGNLIGSSAVKNIKPGFNVSSSFRTPVSNSSGKRALTTLKNPSSGFGTDPVLG